MALQRASPGQIPQGAKILDRDDAFAYMFTEITNHKPLRDVWALKYGCALAGALSSISGILMLQHFRKFYALKSQAFFSTFLPSAFFPFAGTASAHVLYLNPGIYLQESECAVCSELKATSVQGFFGFIWPHMLSAGATLMTASKIGADVPLAYRLREVAKLSILMARSNNGPSMYAGVLLLNVLGVILLTDIQKIQIVNFNKRVALRREIERG